METDSASSTQLCYGTSYSELWNQVGRSSCLDSMTGIR